MFGLFKNNTTKVLEALANAPVSAPVEIEGRPGTIRGTLIVDQAGDRWIEHLIDDDGGYRYWVSIENFDTTIATLWRGVDVWDVQGGPDDARVSYQGVAYRRSEVGTAQFAAKGDTGVLPKGTVDYVDFKGPDGARLSFERFGEAGASRRPVSVSGVCPNCHASLHLDAVGKCSSCASDLMKDHGWFDSWEVAAGREVTQSARLR